MIVISGALVVVALVLLVIGLVIAELGWVYASIAVSLLSFVFLVIGILQRRKEVPAEAAADATADGAEVPVVSSGNRLAGIRDDEPTVTTLPTVPAPASDAAVAGQVLVVAGRPRYHVEGCRYLTGKDANSIDVAEARAEGFTACGVCKPDDALVAAPAPAVSEDLAVEEIADEVPVAVPPVRKAAPARASVASRPVAKRAATAPARKAAAPAKKAAAAPAKKAAAAPAKRAAAPAKKAAAAPAKKSAAPAKKAAPAKAAVAPVKKAVAPVKKAAAPAKKAVAAKAPAKKAPAKKAPAKR